MSGVAAIAGSAPVAVRIAWAFRLLRVQRCGGAVIGGSAPARR
ncbi:hypothetical protein SAMN05519105_0132 [Rhodobacter sp. 24-YEA-8]|nr:hypothetical protein SAMN05519105_0132 [Rhodobacter sp. 24-YEA-8]